MKTFVNRLGHTVELANHNAHFITDSAVYHATHFVESLLNTDVASISMLEHLMPNVINESDEYLSPLFLHIIHRLDSGYKFTLSYPLNDNIVSLGPNTASELIEFLDALAENDVYTYYGRIKGHVPMQYKHMDMSYLISAYFTRLRYTHVVPTYDYNVTMKFLRRFNTTLIAAMNDDFAMLYSFMEENK